MLILHLAVELCKAEPPENLYTCDYDVNKIVKKKFVTIAGTDADGEIVRMFTWLKTGLLSMFNLGEGLWNGNHKAKAGSSLQLWHHCSHLMYACIPI